MEKEYGKISEDQFRRLVERLPEVRASHGEMKELLRRADKEKLREILGAGKPWSLLYELPFANHVAFVLVALGQKKWLERIKESEDPQEEALKSLDSDEDIEWTGGEGGEFTVGDLAGLTATLQRTILSIMLFHRSLSGLMVEVREGSDDALFNLVRVDRCALGCPSIMARLWQAEVTEDKKFFLRLRNAIKGPQHKHWESYRDLRYSLCMLRDLGFDQLSDEQLYHLLVKVLKVYPDVPTARKNLRKQYYESKKIKTL